MALLQTAPPWLNLRNVRPCCPDLACTLAASERYPAAERPEGWHLAAGRRDENCPRPNSQDGCGSQSSIGEHEAVRKFVLNMFFGSDRFVSAVLRAALCLGFRSG